MKRVLMILAVVFIATSIAEARRIGPKASAGGMLGYAAMQSLPIKEPEPEPTPAVEPQPDPDLEREQENKPTPADQTPLSVIVPDFLPSIPKHEPKPPVKIPNALPVTGCAGGACAVPQRTHAPRRLFRRW